MKAVLVLALLACSLALIAGDCVYTHGNGEPQCTADNVRTKYFRNTWDPTHYWACEQEGQPAVSVACEKSGYDEVQKKCVDWEEWAWTERCDPPSMVSH